MGYVLEGPDGAGKSTLAKMLAEHHELSIDHFGPPTKTPLDEYLGFLAEKGRSHKRVLDRFHLGESVYGPIYRGVAPLTLPDLCTIEWALMVRGYTLVHVTRSLKSLVEVLEERGDWMVQVDQLGKIVEAYWEIMHESFMPRFVYDWGSPIFKIPEWPEEMAAQSRHYADVMLGYPGTGSLEPEYILVGERLNPNLIQQSHATPFGYGMGASWLIHAICHNGWQSKVYLTNAKKVTGDERLVGKEIRWLRSRAVESGRPMPRVISLGKTATRVLGDHQIPCIPVNHPSYHRRFHFKKGPNDYARVLLSAL
jgi:hypothetical protein